ncbi:MAG: hypothetical protein ACI8RD_011326 [Bacillariaceae sp.]
MHPNHSNAMLLIVEQNSKQTKWLNKNVLATTNHQIYLPDKSL